MSDYTVLNILTQALQRIGIIAYGETVEAAAAVTARTELNLMLNEWSTTYNNFATYEKTFICQGPVARIGISGANDTPDEIERPAKIGKVQYINGNSVYDLDVRTFYEYTQYTIQNCGIPSIAFIRYEYPSMYIYADSDLTGKTIRVIGKPYYKNYTNNSELVILPPEYVQAIIRNLALRLCPLFGVEATQGLVIEASSGLKHIKRTNAMSFNTRPKSELARVFRRYGRGM